MVKLPIIATQEHFLMVQNAVPVPQALFVRTETSLTSVQPVLLQPVVLLSVLFVHLDISAVKALESLLPVKKVKHVRKALKLLKSVKKVFTPEQEARAVACVRPVKNVLKELELLLTAKQARLAQKEQVHQLCALPVVTHLQEMSVAVLVLQASNVPHQERETLLRVKVVNHAKKEQSIQKLVLPEPMLQHSLHLAQCVLPVVDAQKTPKIQLNVKPVNLVQKEPALMPKLALQELFLPLVLRHARPVQLVKHAQKGPVKF